MSFGENFANIECFLPKLLPVWNENFGIIYSTVNASSRNF